MLNKDKIKTKGEVEMIITYNDDRPDETAVFPNTILAKGREALANSLANTIGDSYDFFVSRMLFGDGGMQGDSPRFVEESRNGLFGVTRANKAVLSTVDPNATTQVVFTVILTFDDGSNGHALNEMALQMNNSDLYSMVTFPDLNKTSSMQITWNWRLSFV
jgi:hypothetical protein